MEGLAAKGNSPGMEFPKQWRCRLSNVGTGVATTIVVIGWSGMLWYCIVGVPLAVASIGTAKVSQWPSFLQTTSSKLLKNYEISVEELLHYSSQLSSISI